MHCGADTRADTPNALLPNSRDPHCSFVVLTFSLHWSCGAVDIGVSIRTVYMCVCVCVHVCVFVCVVVYVCVSYAA